MDNLTEEQWKKIIKKEGCAFEPLWKVRRIYANTPMYLRVYISLLAKKEVFDDLEEYDIGEIVIPQKKFIKLKEKHLGGLKCKQSMN